MLHVMSRSVRFGLRRSVAAMAGCLTAIVAVLAASAAGLTALLAASPRLFDVLRYAGVAYLVWLGIKAWRAPVDDAGAVSATRARSLRALYGTGLLTGLSNPKLIIFAAALFPQFIDTGRPFGMQLTILVASFVGIEFSWQCLYALGGVKLANWLAPARRQRAFNRGTGLMFIGFGGALLGARA
jgi:threonine/homoserine/homoserine lactone efflux protein